MLCFIYILAILLLLSSTSSQAQVTPTTTNVTFEIYDTTNASQYEARAINCTKSTCIVICDTPKGCNQTTIHASKSNTLSLTCSESFSCTSINIISGPKTSVQINCYNKASCSHAIFNVDLTPNTNLSCKNTSACSSAKLNANSSSIVNIDCGSYSCVELEINALDVDISLDVYCNDESACIDTHIFCPLSTTCNIVCAAAEKSCFSMDIYINNKESDINLNCSGFASGCTGSKFVCDGTSKNIISQLRYYNHNNCFIWGCYSDECCPLSFYRGIITCNTADCVINCTNNTCLNYLIDGTFASSLTVNCFSMIGACGQANILCPPNGLCNVNCIGFRVCWKTFVKATNARLLNLICDGKDACENEVIYCPYDRTEACNIDCRNGVDVCRGIDISVDADYVGKYLNLNCPRSNINESCDFLKFNCDLDGSSNGKPPALLVFNENVSQYECSPMNQGSSDYCCPNTSFIFTTTLKPNLSWSGYNTIMPTTSHDDTSTPQLQSASFIGILIALIVAAISIVLVIIYIKKQKLKSSLDSLSAAEPKHRKQSSVVNSQNISNALVAILCIGEYEENDNYIVGNPDPELDNSYLRDLPVDTDVQNLKQLFKKLQYDLFLHENKFHWTEEDIITFLNDTGKQLFDNNNELMYDGLIVCISAHGIEDHIVSSDYKAVRKAALHRIISVNYPKSREIPRMFLIDSCSGSSDRNAKRLSTVQFMNDKGKYFGLDELEQSKGSSLNNAWTGVGIKNKNPDWKLIEVHASNLGFQAKLDTRFGSYLLYEFTKRMEKCIENGETITLGRLFDKIQNDLHNKGKQQIFKSFNNDTSHIKLVVNQTNAQL